MAKNGKIGSNLPEAVIEKLKHLPAKPGCYIYRDEKENVIYVGKAISLRSRVRSYFHPGADHSFRIAQLVRKICDIETIVVDTELEALVLECNLIKKYRPKFNVRMRDDKSYPYITITDEPFPRVLFTRKVRKDKSKYFGPYTSSFQVRDTLGHLHKIFPLIPCGKSWSGKPEQRPCLYFHMGRCLAPCAGLAKREDYQQVLSKVERFLGGREESLVDDLQKEMDSAVENLDFERAATIRDQLKALEHVLQRQKVLTGESVDQDVIAVVKDDRGAAIQMLYIRGGKLIGQRQFILDGASGAPPSEAVQQFVKQYYLDSPDMPREILLPVEIEERMIVQSWLKQQKGSAVTIEVPQQGEKMRLMDMAASNAELALQEFAEELQRKENWVEEAMVQLQEALNLPTLPTRIEGYDISNIQGTSPVGSMVVTENGEAARDEYRRFKIRYHPESPNDFAMMHEVLTRRFRNYLEGSEKFMKLPDVIMIDGGKGQLSAALKARDELGFIVPMIGLAKRHELIYLPTEIGSSGAIPIGADAEYRYDRTAPKEYSYKEIELPLTSPGLMLFRKLRDEAHRFAITYHRKLRDKRLTGSSLEEIPGIGPRRKKLLLRTFGSVEGIRRASVDDLASVPTMTKMMAERVREHLAND